MLSLVILYNSISSPAELHVYSISYWIFIIPLPLTCNCCFFTWRFCRYGRNIQATVSYSILNVNWIFFFFFVPQPTVMDSSDTTLMWLIYFLLPLSFLYVTLESSHKLESHKVQNMAKNHNTNIAIGQPCLLLKTFKQKMINL